MSNPYETMMPTGPFGKAVDRAIAEANEQPWTEADQREAQEVGDRWLAILTAREAVGTHGVVLPSALAEQVIAALKGEETRLSPEMIASMVVHESLLASGDLC